MTQDNNRIRLAITHGDINGVGYEVILKTFSDVRMFDTCTPILYGSTKVASYHKNLLAHHQDLNFTALKNASEAVDRKIQSLPSEEEIDTLKKVRKSGKLKGVELAIVNKRIEKLDPRDKNK